MTENQLEQEALSWLAELGYAVHRGAELAHDGPHPQRVNHRQVVLPGRLRAAIGRACAARAVWCGTRRAAARASP